MSVMCVASPTSATPVIKPRPAVISGIPAAISEPNVNSRMTSAAATPTTVAGPMLKPSALSITWPPAASVRPGTLTALTAFEHRQAGLVGQQVGALVVVDRRERGMPVARDLDCAGRTVGADDAHDVRHLAHPLEQRGDRRAYRGRVDRAVGRVEDDRVDVAALGFELAVEQVDDVLGLGPREAEVGRVLAPDGSRDHGRDDRDRDPSADHPPTMGDAPPSQPEHRTPTLENARSNLCEPVVFEAGSRAIAAARLTRMSAVGVPAPRRDSEPEGTRQHAVRGRSPGRRTAARAPGARARGARDDHVDLDRRGARDCPASSPS